MMKTKIVLGSLFSVFMLLLIPSISAVEMNTVIDVKKSEFLESFQDIGEFKDILDEKGGIYEAIVGLLFIIYTFFLIRFNRSFTLLLLLIDVLYEIGLQLGLIDEKPY